ncbi:MAG: efflux RND transporter permease subunit [Bacteroidaceae bacterium]|nr:efflux RND transporter permease subunit [Bacteroidaceae bacterium]
MLKIILRRPIAVTMCIIALTVIGILSLRHIPVSLMPDIDIPQITVQVSMPGYSAQEVERNVVSPLRGRLMQVTGITDIRSESRMDAGSVRMTFEPGSNVNLLFIEVNEKVDRAMNQMPKDMERPKVMKASAMDIPAFFLDLTLADSSAKASGAGGTSKFAQLSKFARNVVVKRIEQLPQTAMVDVSGTVGTEIDCIPDNEKLQAMGMSVSDIESAIKRNNITLEALSIVDGIYRYNIHFDSQLLTRKDIEDIYINHQGRLFQLKDVCSIEEHIATRNGLVRHDGKECVTMAIIKQNDARMEELKQSMDELLDDMRKEYPDINFQLTRDQTRLLQFTIENLKGNLYMGALMACLVLMLFMKKWRLSLLVVLSIPLSLIITILCFYLLGISMNVISLSGLILGVGMMVDNAIIVVDNITAQTPRIPTKEELEGVVVRSTREVFTPMLSSVLTTCSVFLPLIFLSGTAGALFYDQAMGITTALFASLLVATVVIPVYYMVLHKNGEKVKEIKGEKVNFVGLKLPGGVKCYEAVLKWMLRHTRLVLALFVISIPLMGILLLHIEKERMPKVAQYDTLLTIDWNSNISAQENDRRIAGMMGAIKEDVQTSTSMIGAQEFMLAHTKDITSSEAVVYLKAADSEHLDKIKRQCTAYLQQHYPQASAEYGEPGNLYNLIFSTDEADLEIHLQNREGRRPTTDASRAFRDTLLRHFPNLEISPVMTETNIRYVADMEQMAIYKVSYDALYRRLRELVSRGTVFSINEGAQSVPVKMLSGAMSFTGVERHILAECVKNADGTDIPISYLVREAKGEDYKRLQAGNGGEFYTLSLNAKDREVEEVMTFVNEYIHRPQSQYSASFAGGYFSSRMLISELSVVLAVALALLYFILAAQFESLVQPLVILLEMVVDVFFVLVGLWILGESLNLMSMTGLVVMSGIIINDSILKIDTINHSPHLKSGTHKGLIRAIMEAGQRRLRPIVMTSLTTILALLPFLSHGSMGAAIQYPLSLTLIIGMTIGTAVSLFFIPMLYYLIAKLRMKS